MKRILLTTVLLLIVGVFMYAQQGGSEPPQSAQTKQTAQQYLSQAKSNSSQFESTLADLKARNTSNKDAYNFNRLRNEIDRLESTINSEQKSMRANLDRGIRVNSDAMNRIENFINQHKAKIAELEYFVSSN